MNKLYNAHVTVMWNEEFSVSFYDAFEVQFFSASYLHIIKDTDGM